MMTPLQLYKAVESAGVMVARGGSYEDGRPWVEMSSTTWLEVGKSGKFELFWSSRDGGPVNELDNLLDLPRLLPKRLRANHAKELPRRNAKIGRQIKQSKPIVNKKTKQTSQSIAAVLAALTAVQQDVNSLLDKKGIAQIVKHAVELRDLGKKARS